MAKTFNVVNVSRVAKTGELTPKFDFTVTLVVDYDPQGLSIKLRRGKILLVRLMKVNVCIVVLHRHVLFDFYMFSIYICNIIISFYLIYLIHIFIGNLSTVGSPGQV